MTSAEVALPPRLHPLSSAFQWLEHPGPYALISPEQAQRFDRDGCFVLEGAIAPELLERLTEAIDPLEVAESELLRSMGGKRFISDAEAITFSTHLVTRSAFLADFARSEVFQGLCADLIGPDVRLYWDQAVYKKPGGDREFPWHQDNGYTFVRPEAYLTCWIPLVDATVSNGCPWVVPGLHRHGTFEHSVTPIGLQCLQDPASAVPVEAAAGSIIVFSSLRADARISS
ncbi:MAG: phytanoyl-CoA dioxygenase family protein [Mycobacteriales bacterium]